MMHGAYNVQFILFFSGFKVAFDLIVTIHYSFGVLKYLISLSNN
jgi:hypothetical protein